MTMAWVLFGAVLVGQTATGLWSWLRLWQVRRTAHKSVATLVPVVQPHVIVVIPALREQDVIAETVEYFSALEFDPDRTLLCIVTTEREAAARTAAEARAEKLVDDLWSRSPLPVLVARYSELLPVSYLKELHGSVGHIRERGVLRELTLSQIAHAPSTADLAAKLVEELNTAYGQPVARHFHYPGTKGMYAHQVNYAFEQVSQSGWLTEVAPDRCYLVPFCVDSRPGRDVLNRFAHEVTSSNFPDMVQMYTVYTTGWDSLSSLAQAAALMQSNVDLRVGLANVWHPHWLSAPVLASHGVFIRTDIFAKLGGLSTDFWGEDTYLGGYVKATNTQVRALPVVGEGDSPPYFAILVQQAAVWFRISVKEAVPMWRHAKQRSGRATLSGLVWLLQRFRMNLCWLTAPLFVLYTLLLPLLEGKVAVWFLALVTYCLMVWSIQLSTVITVRAFGKQIATTGRMYLFSALYFMVSNFGPIHALRQMVWEWLFHVGAEKTKTAR